MTAREKGVLEDLLHERVMNTDFKIDFSSLLDEERQEAYAQHLEYLNASKSLK